MFNRFTADRNTLRVRDGRIFPAVNESRSPAGIHRIYLLVHGFNNDPIQARSRYEAFRARMRDIIGADGNKIWELYWPGYDDWIAEPLRQRLRPVQLLHSSITAVRYYKQVPKACVTGALLGEYIRDLGSAMAASEVLLIGHSLGCRVIMEAIKYLLAGRTDRNRIPAICLMAAAVPSEFFDDPNRFLQASEFPLHRIVLHSRRDTVLKHAFPAGQSLAHEGLWPEAAGLHGRPRVRWTARDETMLQHGDYWSSPVTTAHIARLFGRTTPHQLPAFALVPRELPSSVDLPEYALPERAVGS